MPWKLGWILYLRDWALAIVLYSGTFCDRCGPLIQCPSVMSKCFLLSTLRHPMRNHLTRSLAALHQPPSFSSIASTNPHRNIRTAAQRGFDNSYNPSASTVPQLALSLAPTGAGNSMAAQKAYKCSRRLGHLAWGDGVGSHGRGGRGRGYAGWW
jgi:hypothetical protein